jgi:hypothetical protein
MANNKLDFIEIYYWRQDDTDRNPTYAITYKNINRPDLRVNAANMKLTFPCDKEEPLPEAMLLDPMKEGKRKYFL